MPELISKDQFDWSELIETIAGDPPPAGHQVINFFSTDKDYRRDPESIAFVEHYLAHGKPFSIDAALMKYACGQVMLDGAFLEMGVCTGRTINFIAALHPEKTVYGFDSFCGLPEPWSGRTDFALPKGVFAFKNARQLPPVVHNVRLIKGLFQDTLPQFKQQILGTTPIAFLHVDCDIYSSTAAIFAALGENIVDGTVILFDDMYNYPGFRQHELKAFEEFLSHHHKAADYFAFNTQWEQVAVRITNP